jgi:membrane dipeptidase
VTTRRPSPPAPGPLEDYAAQFDQVLARLPQIGGVVMVSFISLFAVQGDEHARWQEAFERETGVKLGDSDYEAALAKYTAVHPEPRAKLEDVADHIEHVIQVAGEDHVGIGGDLDGISTTPVGLESVADYPKLFTELLRRGHSEERLKKLAGLNALRVMRGAEAAAAKLRDRAAADVLIEEANAPK